MTTAGHSGSLKTIHVDFPFLFMMLALLFVAGAAPTALHSQTYKDLHNFNCATDGCNANYSGIMAQGRDGDLYGTSHQGGSSGLGTVFKLTPSGTISILHNFAGSDGSHPYSGLTLGLDGNFYGTAFDGGANNLGTIFKITPTGTLTTLHSFTATDGGNSYAPPVLGKNGNYYGVDFRGTAYSVTSSGTFKLLNPAIPSSSSSPLFLATDGNFYGTTINGGTGGYGTVFRMSAAGVVKIVYNFEFTHGAYEYDPVVQGADGLLYASIPAGGSIANAAGLVFKLTTAGNITVLHQFDASGLTEGIQPYSGLVAASDGNFYGATSLGNASGSASNGSIFKISKAGVYSSLYTFDGTHGANQYATWMQHTNGTLYGETSGGGSTGNGVFFSFSMGIPPFVSLVGFPSGAAGTTVEILGQGFNNTSKVMFGTGSASFAVVSDTYMTAVVPATGVTGALTVTTPTGTLVSKQIYKVLPVITSFSPASGPIGTNVVITGSGLTGATKVSFGGVAATNYKVTSPTQITATVPAGAKTGKIAVVTKGGTANSQLTFTVTL